VVTVTVVHQPDARFDDTLEGLAEQDFPNLKHLFLVVGEPGDVVERIQRRVPGAFVRSVGDPGGFGAACNEVLTIVKGDNGFFCLLHDDVALDPTAIRLMVEELYRSNAGIVGPKLVEWDDPGILQHVGMDVDRFGEIDPIVEPGEVDQEQHDAVRDVFAVPSACMLVRADLFRTLGGFPSDYEFHGEDLNLCWRAHLGGARVVVVPSARARHVESLVERRPDVPHARLRARHRMHTVLSLTGGRRLPITVVQLFAVSIGELLVGLLTGRAREGWEATKGLFGSVAHVSSIRRARRDAATVREVPDSEVAGLQLRGSARFRSYLRRRGGRGDDPEATSERRWRESAGSAPAITWLALLTLLVLGSREWITGRVPNFGQFLPYPDSPRAMASQYWSGWWTDGLGSATAMPTGYALIAASSVVTLFRMGVLHTVGVLGAVVAGYAGMWRLGSVFIRPRARIVALVVYALAPLAASLLSFGQWGALAVYAGTPWFIHAVRRGVGIFVTAEGEDELPMTRRRRLRWLAQATLTVAVTTAFVPTFLMLALIIAGVLAIAATLAGLTRPAIGTLVLAVASVVLALIVHLPWTVELFRGGWSASLGVDAIAAEGVGWWKILSFDVGAIPTGGLGVVLLAPVAFAPLIARGPRFAWALRGGLLTGVFMWLAVLSDRGSLDWPLPAVSVLLVPAAVGAAISAGALVEAFDHDVRGGSFGFRQPLAIVALLATFVGLAPGVLAITDGRWRTPRLTLQSALVQLRENPEEGDYRVLWVGDPRLMPVASWEYQPGLAYAITDDGPLSVDNFWTNGPTSADEGVAEVLRAIASQTTLRSGRLLAPYGVRYIVVPVADDAISPSSRPEPLPDGLTAALEDQLDLGRALGSPLNYLVYENTAWIPTVAQLSEGGAAASREAGFTSIAQSSAGGSQPLAVGSELHRPTSFEVVPGTVQVSVPFSEDWSLTVGGSTLRPRPSFGATTAFDVTTAGAAELRYDTPISRRALVVVQVLLWVALCVAASRFTPRRRRRTASMGALGAPTVVPELEMTAAIVKPSEDDLVPWLDESAASTGKGDPA
jgi:GT2 family glycosyltransferase